MAIHPILNDFMKQERLPQDLKESEILASYKQKGDMMWELQKDQTTGDWTEGVQKGDWEAYQRAGRSAW